MKPITILTSLFCSGLLSLSVQTGCFAAQANQLIVDFSRQTGPVYHGTGFLYCLSEPNVPNANVLVPLKPDVTSQKAPNGLQHPGGDAVQIAGTFLGAGGNAVFDYMQDIYSQFPYQNLGLSDYLPKVQTEVTEILATPFPNSFNGPGNKLSFLGVQVPVTGTYKIVIYFAAEADLTATVTAQTVSFPSSRSASLVNTQIAQVQLSAGSNEITFSNDTGPAPAIDKIEILLPVSGS
jgi:hypothetical protein